MKALPKTPEKNTHQLLGNTEHQHNIIKKTMVPYVFQQYLFVSCRCDILLNHIVFLAESVNPAPETNTKEILGKKLSTIHLKQTRNSSNTM